jgi:hypothetical protein
MKKAILFGILSVLLAMPIAALAHGNNQNQCNANNPDNCPVPSQICDNGQAVGNPHCNPTLTQPPLQYLTVTPVSPTNEPTVEPTVEATPSQAVTPEATATPSPKQEEKKDSGSTTNNVAGESGHMLTPCTLKTCGWK